MDCTITQSCIDFFGLQNLILFALISFLFVYLVILRKRQPKNIIAYRTDNGDVTISRSAVVELVRTACEQLDQISKPSLKVFTKKGLTHFDIRIHLSSGSSLKEVEKTLQNHLRESLSQDLGIENLGNINIVVTNFKSSRVRSANIPTIYTTPSLPVEEHESDSDDAGPVDSKKA